MQSGKRCAHDLGLSNTLYNNMTPAYQWEIKEAIIKGLNENVKCISVKMHVTSFKPLEGQFHLEAASAWPGLTQMKVSQARGGGSSSTEGLAEIHTGRHGTKQVLSTLQGFLPPTLMTKA